MTDDAYKAGRFCWADVATTDVSAAKTFYTSLFGWEFRDFEMEGAPLYTVFRYDGGDVCGAGPMPEELQRAGVPPFWSAYVGVHSVDATAAKAAELGGAVPMQPFNIPGTGRMAIIHDPQGAALSLWQLDSVHTGYRHTVPVPGTVCWNELVTSDVEAAAAFYSALFEWRVKDSSFDGQAYYEFLNPDGSVGGMLPVTPEMGNVRPHWLTYFAVGDCDETVSHAFGLGATVVVPCMDVPRVGRFAVLRDPPGAAFAVIAISEGAG